jgi:preprotein translocase subunit SecA
MEAVRAEIIESVRGHYAQKISDLESKAADVLLYVVLNTLDDAWREHLLNMEELKRGIGLRAIGQKDPLLEYQFESYNLFQEMMLRVKESFTEKFFRARIISENTPRRERKLLEARDFHLLARGSSVPPPFHAGEGKRDPFRKGVKVGRNDPCPCGSGKKYKHCCGKEA